MGLQSRLLNPSIICVFPIFINLSVKMVSYLGLWQLTHKEALKNESQPLSAVLQGETGTSVSSYMENCE